MEKMTLLLSRLPWDVVRREILPWTYSPQDARLLHDVRNFTDSLRRVDALFARFWVRDLGHTPPYDQEWLLNNLYCYVQTHFVFFARFFDRYVLPHTHTHFMVFVKKSVRAQIRILWALMRPEERQWLLEQYTRVYEE